MATEAARGGRGRSRVGAAVSGVVLGVGALLTTSLARPDVHAEFVKYAAGGDSITAYIAYPERRDAAPAVLVIHEI